MTDEGATYPLALVRELLAAKRYRLTGIAVIGAGELGFDEADIVGCVSRLDESLFYKTMEAERRPGYWQDVYRPVHGGIELYVKVQVEGKDPDELLVVIQFKRR